MTIAKRLIVLLAVPLLILLGIGLFTRYELLRIEDRTRYLAETRVVALARLGDIARTVAELRVNLRSHLLATTQDGRAAARALFDEDQAELTRLLRDYADKRITSEQDRRLLNDYRSLSQEWLGGAEQAMSLAEAGQHAEAIALLFSPAMARLGASLSQVSREWIQNYEQAAMSAGQAAVTATEDSRRNLLVVVAMALALSGLLGFLTFRRIVTPIRALEMSVKTIAAGDYAKDVPFTTAKDETGGLARSIDVLKQGAASMEEQRWVKSTITNVTGDLQAASLAEFGQRLLSGLVPVLGGGVAGFYLFEEDPACSDELPPTASQTDTASADSFRLGEGLVGQCAQERKTVTLTNLPPDYLQIASGLGTAAPVQAVALPLLSRDSLLGVLEIASFQRLQHAAEDIARGTFAGRGHEPGDSAEQCRNAGTARHKLKNRPGGSRSRPSELTCPAGALARDRAVLPQRSGTRTGWLDGRGREGCHSAGECAVRKTVRLHARRADWSAGGNARSQGYSRAASGVARVISSLAGTTCMGANRELQRLAKGRFAVSGGDRAEPAARAPGRKRASRRLRSRHHRAPGTGEVRLRKPKPRLRKPPR